MNKRQFLAVAALAGSAPVLGQQAAAAGAGPALLTVSGAVGRPNRWPFAVTLSVEKARRQRFTVATLMDGKPLPLGGLGPLWAMVDADRIPELASKPLAERFGECPWGLYHIEVKAA